MMRPAAVAFALFLLAAMLGSPISAAAPGDVASEWASPTDYPSGLASDGAHVFLADWRAAKIHQIDPSDAVVVRTIDAPTLNPHGLTFGEGLLWVSDDHTGGIFAMNLETGIVENMFQAPQERAAGLAYHDGVLFVLAGDRIYRVTPDDGTILGSFEVPHAGARCIAHDGTYLWVSNRVEDEIYLVDPNRDGTVISILPSPGPYPAGLVWHDGHLWNADFQQRKLHQIVIHDEQKHLLADSRTSRVEHLWTMSNYGPGDVLDLQLNLAVPGDLEHQTLLGDVAFSMEPDAIETDRWDQPCAVFTFDRVPAGEKIVVTYSVDVELAEIFWLIFPDRVGSLDDIPADIRSRYTADTSRYNFNSPYMQETVREIVGEETNPYWIAREIYDHIIGELEYQMIGGWDIPEVVLQRGSGSCSEYTYTFIALCRAAGVPARYQGSISMRGDDASIDEAFHRWAQIYLPNYGWIPVDANRGDKALPADQARGFGTLKNTLLITTHGGGGSEYLHWGYNSYADYKTTGYAKIDETHFGFWSPLDPEEDHAEEHSSSDADRAMRSGGGSDGGSGAAGQCGVDGM